MKKLVHGTQIVYAGKNQQAPLTVFAKLASQGETIYCIEKVETMFERTFNNQYKVYVSKMVEV